MEAAKALEAVAKTLDQDSEGVRRARKIRKRNEGVVFSRGRGRRGFKRNGKWVSGLIGRIESRFRLSSAHPWDRPKRRALPNVVRAKSSCATSGSRHGSLVHGEISRLCTAISRFQVSRIRKRKFDLCTLRFMSVLARRRWIPVLSELPVSNDGIGTAGDLHFVSALTGEYGYIEIKTGHENETYGPVPGDATIPFFDRSLRDCPRDRHDLQVAGTILLGGVMPHRAYVVRILPKLCGVEIRESTLWKRPGLLARLQPALS